MAIIGELNGLRLGILLVNCGGWRAVCFINKNSIANREREACFKAFMNNNYVGLVLFLGLATSYCISDDLKKPDDHPAFFWVALCVALLRPTQHIAIY
ncbi:hypothetical protein ACLK17_25695 [Escherichia coli]